MGLLDAIRGQAARPGSRKITTNPIKHLCRRLSPKVRVQPQFVGLGGVLHGVNTGSIQLSAGLGAL